MIKVNIKNQFNNKAFQCSEGGKEVTLTPLGSGFPLPSANTFEKSNYDIHYADDLDNFECKGNIVDIHCSDSVSVVRLIALGLYGDYHESVVIGEDNKTTEYKVTFPFMHRTSLSEKEAKLFYTSEYVVSQSSLSGVVKQGISLFEIEINLYQQTKISFIKFPRHLGVHIFAITLF
ncbi:hypothetical protein JZO78_03245 [Enterococcus ureilyticus]|uniref:hypothetical protein n=1 Tax=Enterococcus ureilyticus TaxID=1131292 RepID=UPI001A919EE1|nr:hypothetical protein [Enterococcus ureilyticus]MBO0445354.1 hypothetical protein [Enterococcus ureilyticus]